MFYELSFDKDILDEPIGGGGRTIYAADSNLDDIRYKDVKEGYFRYLIRDGIELTDIPELIFHYSSKVSNLKNEYLLNFWDWPIIHQTVKESIENHGIRSRIQFIPITLKDIDTDEEIHEYYAMNILNHIEAIDLNKSKHDYDEGLDMYWFLPRAIYLDESVCQGNDIFRPSKDTSSIYVSQKVKDLIEEHRWVGFKFRKEKIS